MNVCRFYGQEDIRHQSTERPAVGPEEVLIDVDSCGICGSDLHKYVEGPMFMSDSDPHPLTDETLPITMGHEISGTISKAGDAVTSVSENDTVVVNPILYCRDCRYCRAGDYRFCDNSGIIGVATSGGFAEQVAVPEENAIRLPKNIPLEHGALVEPLSVTVHAVHNSQIGIGDSVAIFGCGPIGLGILQAARTAGSEPIYVSEPRKSRRQLAADLGADVLLDPEKTDVVDYITTETGGGVDVAFEVAGIEATFNQAIKSTKKAGEIRVVSIFTDTIETMPIDFVTSEKTIQGTFAYTGPPAVYGDFQRTIGMLRDGKFDAETMISSRISLSEVTSAFEKLHDPSSEETKILVKP